MTERMRHEGDPTESYRGSYSRADLLLDRTTVIAASIGAVAFLLPGDHLGAMIFFEAFAGAGQGIKKFARPMLDNIDQAGGPF